MPLVLVHNDVVRNPDHAWDDVEGERYHYPNKYQSKVITGEPFVYYRGVNRVGGKRGPAEYVGSGRIGDVWLDPARPTGRNKAWYCSIEGYQRFAEPVPAKVDGLTLENIPANMWRDGIRPLDPSVYARIVGEVSAQPALAASAPAPLDVTVLASDSLIMPAAPVQRTNAKSSYRRSRQAKAVGDWAEAVALRYITEQIVGCSQCVHRAAAGETPGWDIDYVDSHGHLQRVEVKGTIAGAFSGVELTAGEMRAAKAHAEGYWLCLVANCFTAAPKVQLIRNPAERLAAGSWTATPAVYSVQFRSSL